MASSDVSSPEKPVVMNTSKKLDKLTTPEELKKMPTTDLSIETPKKYINRKFLDSTELEELCSFEDNEFSKISMKVRIERVWSLREWFWMEHGENAAVKSGFMYGLSIESRLLSFLIARNFNLAQTQSMIENHIAWLAKYNIYDIDVKVFCPTAWKSGC